jgi:hypothetical protein
MKRWRRYAVEVALIALISASPVALSTGNAGAAILTTTTTLAAPAWAPSGGSVTLTATVSVENLGGLVVTPSGTVTFTFDGSALGHQSVASPCVLTVITCTASLTTSSLLVGVDKATATYGGDTLSGGSSASAKITDGVPTAPLNLTASTSDGSVELLNGVDLAWTAPTFGAPTSYDLYRRTASTPFAEVASTTSTSYQDLTPSVTDGTAYTYEVEGVNAAGTSAPSNEADATPNGMQSTNCAASGTCSTGTVESADDSVQLSVTAAPTGTPYNITEDFDTTSLAFGNGYTNDCAHSAAGDIAEVVEGANGGTKSITDTESGADSAQYQADENAPSGVLYLEPCYASNTDFSAYSPVATCGALGAGPCYYLNGQTYQYGLVPSNGNASYPYEGLLSYCTNQPNGSMGNGNVAPCVTTAQVTFDNGIADFDTMTINAPANDPKIGRL